MKKFLDQSAFHDAAQAGRASGRSVLRAGDGAPEPIAGTRRVRFCFSDGSIDRMGDTVNPAGWRLDAFRANPQALWSHKSDEPPIGRACNVAVEGDRLMGDIEFASADVYPFADQIFRLVKAGFLNTVSVGFMPIEYEFSDQAGRGIDFLEQELLEISVCPVPANANALVEVRSWRQRRAERRARRAGLAEIEAVETRTEAELIATARHYQFRHLPQRNLDTERGRLERAGDIRRVLRMPDPVDPRLIHAEVVSRTFRW